MMSKPILCIPSYSRPNGVAIERCKDLPLDKYLFIRAEQKDLYAKWSNNYTIVTQLTGTDIGKVRRNIMRWAHLHKFSWVFMLDDDIYKVECLGHKEDGTITSKRIIANIPGPRMELEAFKTWYKCAKHNSLVLSSPNHRAYDRFHHGELSINKSACIQCVLVYVPSIIAVGNYKSLSITGNEDYYIQYQLMKSGYLTGKVGSIEYNCPSIGQGAGVTTQKSIPTSQKGTIHILKLFLIMCAMTQSTSQQNLLRQVKNQYSLFGNLGAQRVKNLT